MSSKPPFFSLSKTMLQQALYDLVFCFKKSRRLVTRDVSIFTTDLLFGTQRVASDAINARAGRLKKSLNREQ